MDIMELGALGELVGGIAVLVTLAYLALQIRQSGRTSSLNAGHSIANEIATFLERLALDPEVHSVWERGIHREPLDEAESDRFGRLMTAMFIRLLDAHRHEKLDSEMARYYDGLARYHLGMDAVQQWWGRQSETVRTINPGLARYVEERLSEVGGAV